MSPPRESGCATSPTVREGRRDLRWPIRILALAAVVVILYFALRGAELADVWRALQALKLWQIGIILAIDVSIHALMAARWWLIVRTEDRGTPYLPLVAMRLAAFGVSYFTLGPQVGGEPLQILYLRRQRKTTFARAAASVLMDKLLELLANFALLLLALSAIPRTQILGGFPAISSLAFFVLLCLAAWPVAHVVLLGQGRYPVTAALRVLPALSREARLVRHVRAAERLAGQFCRRHTGALIRAVLVSLAAAGASVMEYSFITSFVVSGLSFWQNISAWSAGWLSFLFPTPAGLGALEASQVLALGTFGVSSGTAIVVALIMRARDLLFGGTGLVIAAATTAHRKSETRSLGVLLEQEPPDGMPKRALEAETVWEERHD